MYDLLTTTSYYFKLNKYLSTLSMYYFFDLFENISLIVIFHDKSD